MLDVPPSPTVSFPDNPLKWEGWGNYKADNPYERLCLDPATKPSAAQIEQHCTALLQWWHKKLPLKSQPSNPLAQLLGRGIDEAPRCLVQARVQLLDPARRQQVDDGLAASAREEALAEFSNFVAFSVSAKVLTADAETILTEFGVSQGLSEAEARSCIDEQLKLKNARRAAPAPPPQADRRPKTRAESEMEFHRILRLSDLDMADATKQVRQIFITIAENLGIELERAEDLLDDYLELGERAAASGAAMRVAPLRAQPMKAVASIPRPLPVQRPATAPAPRTDAAPPVAAPPVAVVAAKGAPIRLATAYTAPIGIPMLLIPAGEFVMGSDADDAAPNEQPLTPVSLGEFYMARYPVTNAQYEQFDPAHRQKRMPTAGDDHPVVYVTSFEAVKFCQWLSQKDGKSYRLPTEAEWEYAARGTDGRKYPWGNTERRGDLANFADASTTFAWRDPLIHDGYPETSPLGAFPRGASFFGVDDMAGNVWEWCLDFYQPLAGAPKRNPRGLATGPTRLYRGGSWKSRFSNLRTTVRSSNAPSYASNDVGFRVVCECGNSASDTAGAPGAA